MFAFCFLVVVVSAAGSTVEITVIVHSPEEEDANEKDNGLNDELILFGVYGVIVLLLIIILLLLWRFCCHKGNTHGKNTRNIEQHINDTSNAQNVQLTNNRNNNNNKKNNSDNNSGRMATSNIIDVVNVDAIIANLENDNKKNNNEAFERQEEGQRNTNLLGGEQKPAIERIVSHSDDDRLSGNDNDNDNYNFQNDAAIEGSDGDRSSEELYNDVNKNNSSKTGRSNADRTVSQVSRSATVSKRNTRTSRGSKGGVTMESPTPT